jgi:hypothetical protein
MDRPVFEYRFWKLAAGQKVGEPEVIWSSCGASSALRLYRRRMGLGAGQTRLNADILMAVPVRIA